jgi:hypothetical protein
VSSSSLGRSVRSWLWWIAEPWRSVTFAAALVGSLALPVVVLTAGPMFRLAAADGIATRVVDDLQSGTSGLIVSGKGSFAATDLDPLNDELRRRLDVIGRMEPPTTTMITDPIQIEQTTQSGRRGEVRLFARTGAVEALDVVERTDSSDGAWVSATLAAEAQLHLGDAMVINGTELPIVGVYADLWSSDLNDFWRAVPGDFVPRFLRTFAQPDFELAIVDGERLARLGVVGRVTWQVPLHDPPTTYTDLRALAAAYHRMERDAVRPTVLGDAYRSFRSEPDKELSFFTSLFDAQDDAASATADLSQPIRTATLAGAAAGLGLSTMGAVFAVRRKRIEYRLLAADGDGWWRFFGRSLAQYVLPTLVGVTAGVAIGYATVSAIGPAARVNTSAIDVSDVALAAAAACLLAAAVTASASVRLANGLNQEVGRVSGGWLFGALGLTIAMWLQIGRDHTPQSGPLVIAFPFVGIVTGVVVAVAGLRWLVQRAGRTGSRLPTTWFLAWRALTRSQNGALLLTAAIGVAAGLAVLSTTFVASVDTATHDKAVTTVGSNTRLDLIGPPGEAVFPAETTVVRSIVTVIDEQDVQIIAIDPDTFARSVRWPDSFGGSAQGLVERLAGSASTAVPAVLVRGGTVPQSGDFGRTSFMPYDVVGTIGSIPLASPVYPTLVIRADVLAAYASGGETDPDAIIFDTPQSGLFGFAYTVVSKAGADDVVGAATDARLRTEDVRTLVDEIGSVSSQSTRWAFDYLGILAAIGALAALGALTLYLSERRTELALSTAMTMQMGMPRRTMTVAAVIEMVGLTTTALIAGMGSALLAVAHVFAAFEPDPRVPPIARAVIDGVQLIVVGAAVIGVVAVIAAAVQLRSSRAVTAEVLRG